MKSVAKTVKSSLNEMAQKSDNSLLDTLQNIITKGCLANNIDPNTVEVKNALENLSKQWQISSNNNNSNVWPCSLNGKVEHNNDNYIVTVNIDLRKALSPNRYASLNIVEDIIEITLTKYLGYGDHAYSEIDLPDWLIIQDPGGDIDYEISTYCNEIEDAVESKI